MERVSRAVAASAAAMRRTAQRPQQQQEQQQEEGEEARSASLNGRQVATLLSCLSAAGNLIGSECLVRVSRRRLGSLPTFNRKQDDPAGRAGGLRA